jgi:molybdate transport system ATP-binding protein
MAIQMSERETAQLSSSAGRDPANAGLTVDVRTGPIGADGDPFALDVRFAAPAGVTVLFGASGAGKTTVLDCIAGLRRPEAGRIEAGERVLFDAASGTNLPVANRHVGYVFQSLALFPHMTADDNIQYGIANHGAAARRTRVDEIADSFAIRHVLKRHPREISGGERQRVALARALVTDPMVLLLDEPLSGLDLPTKSRIMNDLRRWNDRHCIPILYVTHDRAEVFAMAERVVALEGGTVIAQGSPFEVLESPRQESMAYLSGFENILDGIVKVKHEDRGTMTCAVGPVELEVPLTRIAAGAPVRIAIRAGDILLATVRPVGLSARNIIPGRIVSLARRDMVAVAQVDCGTTFEVHLTPHAQQSLGLIAGSEVWLVLKTHSCHLLAQKI